MRRFLSVCDLFKYSRPDVKPKEPCARAKIPEIVRSGLAAIHRDVYAPRHVLSGNEADDARARLLTDSPV